MSGRPPKRHHIERAMRRSAGGVPPPARPPELPHAPAPARFAGRNALPQEILIAQFRGGSRQGIELVVVQPSDRHLALYSAARRQQVHERNTAYFAGDLVGADAIQKSLGSGPADVVL